MLSHENYENIMVSKKRYGKDQKIGESHNFILTYFFTERKEEKGVFGSTRIKRDDPGEEFNSVVKKTQQIERIFKAKIPRKKILLFTVSSVLAIL